MYGRDRDDDRDDWGRDDGPAYEPYGRPMPPPGGPPRRNRPPGASGVPPHRGRQPHGFGMPQRGGHPRDDFGMPPRESFGDTREGFGNRGFHDEQDTGYPGGASAAWSARGNGRGTASGRLRSAGRRVGRVLGWFGVLVIAPLIVGILAGAVGQHIGL